MAKLNKSKQNLDKTQSADEILKKVPAINIKKQSQSFEEVKTIQIEKNKNFKVSAVKIISSYD